MILTCLLGLPSGSPLGAQQGSPARAKLNIVVVEGEGAINGIRQRAAHAPVVRVEDENQRPVARAAVLFMLPDSGPGGVFAHNARSLLVRTDKTGRAVAKGLRANDRQGKFEIRVQASFQGVTVTASMTQVNSIKAAAGAGGVSRKLIVILAAVGAAVAAGVVVARRHSGSTDATPTISAGTPTVGGPH